MNHISNSSSSSLCSSFNSGATPDLSSFAYTLFALLTSSSSNETNVLISPFSIASALALVFAGATIDSLCQTQLRDVLGVKSHSDIPLLSHILLSSSSSSSGVNLSIANGIWFRGQSQTDDDGEIIKTSYKEMVHKEHDAMVNILPKTYETINEYVSEKTGGLIEDLMEGKEVDPLTVLVLVNAVFFKGSWKEQFDKEKTTKGTFHSLKPNNKIIPREAMMMKSTRITHFGMDIKALGGAHCALLQYGNNNDNDDSSNESFQDFGALFLLPNQNNEKSMQSMIFNLVQLMTSMSDDATTTTVRPLQQLMQNDMRRAKVALSIPRFKISYGVKQLKSELQHLGIKEAFNTSGKELFNEMTDDPLVYLSEVYHKAVMEVTEEGTVAAAATAGVMMTRSIPRPPPELIFDRPFVVVVVHLETGLPLFMGKIDDPELVF